MARFLLLLKVLFLWLVVLVDSADVYVDERDGGAGSSHDGGRGIDGSSLHSHLPTPPVNGSERCPCWTDQSTLPPISFDDFTSQAQEFLGNELQFSSYGYGCHFHDFQMSQACKNHFEPHDEVSSSTTWCERAWCWVDPNQCNLQHRRSISYKNLTRFYSYATCRYVDSFDSAFRRFAKPLAGRTMKVGFNHNSGGYVGAFSRLERNFDGNLSDWSGPVVDFALEAAALGGFDIEVVPPPDFLLNRSLAFFGGSRFSYCAYATELGFLDFCIAQYTITNSRAWAAKWVTLGPQELRLIVMNEGPSNSQLLADTIQIIFLPFETSTWLFICLFVIPVLGLLMVVHERGQRGSAYPTTVAAVCDETERGGLKNEVQEHRIPIWRQMVRSVYVSFLSCLQGAYSKRVVSLGAHFNLLAISFAIVLIVEVYVANLMAILTERAKQRPVESLDDVRDRRLRVCSIRTGFEVTNSIHELPGSYFVKDPIELGGDGEPGFNCADCNVAQRVFDFMDPVKAETDERYCHVAVTQQQDLEVLQGNGRHCNKTFVGDVVGSATTGFPVHSPEVLSFLQGVRSEGSFMKIVLDAKPKNICPTGGGVAMTEEAFLEGTAFNISELSGIWVLGFGLAAMGLLVTLYMRISSHVSKRSQRVRLVVGYNQHGEVVERVSRRSSHLDGLLDSVNLSFNNGVFEVSSKKISSSSPKGKSSRSGLDHSMSSNRWGDITNKTSLPSLEGSSSLRAAREGSSSSRRRLGAVSQFDPVRSRPSWYEREKSMLLVEAIVEDDEEFSSEELVTNKKLPQSPLLQEVFVDDEYETKQQVEPDQTSESMMFHEHKVATAAEGSGTKSQDTRLDEKTHSCPQETFRDDGDDEDVESRNDAI